jgi:hypothetical protein
MEVQSLLKNPETARAELQNASPRPPNQHAAQRRSGKSIRGHVWGLGRLVWGHHEANLTNTVAILGW